MSFASQAKSITAEINNLQSAIKYHVNHSPRQPQTRDKCFRQIERLLTRLRDAFPTVVLLVTVCWTLAGCGGGEVNIVTDSYLESYEQTTIGNAFNTYFADPHWELKEMANKTLFVVFTGKAKRNSNLLLEGTKVLVQFTLLKDRTFKLSHVDVIPISETEEEVKKRVRQLELIPEGYRRLYPSHLVSEQELSHLAFMSEAENADPNLKGAHCVPTIGIGISLLLDEIYSNN